MEMIFPPPASVGCWDSREKTHLLCRVWHSPPGARHWLLQVPHPHPLHPSQVKRSPLPLPGGSPPYLVPATAPSFFPRGSSSSTPHHSPLAKSVSPTYRTTPVFVPPTCWHTETPGPEDAVDTHPRSPGSSHPSLLVCREWGEEREGRERPKGSQEGYGYNQGSPIQDLSR